MRKIVVVALTLASAAAFGGPRGMAGPSVGFGGLLGNQAFVGGKADFAQAGAKTAEGLEDALAKGEATLKKMISGHK